MDSRQIGGVVGQTVKDGALGFALLVDVLKGQAGPEYIVTQVSFAKVMERLRANLSISEKGKDSSILQMTLQEEDPPDTAFVDRASAARSQRRGYLAAKFAWRTGDIG